VGQVPDLPSANPDQTIDENAFPSHTRKQIEVAVLTGFAHCAAFREFLA
jgi:hypothetical protein